MLHSKVKKNVCEFYTHYYALSSIQSKVCCSKQLQNLKRKYTYTSISFIFLYIALRLFHTAQATICECRYRNDVGKRVRAQAITSIELCAIYNFLSF